MSVVVTSVRLPVAALLTYIGQFKKHKSPDGEVDQHEILSKTVTTTLVLLTTGIDVFAMIDDVIATEEAFREWRASHQRRSGVC